MSLVRAQFKKGAGIFGCDGSVVFSDAEVELISGLSVRVTSERVDGSFGCANESAGRAPARSNIFVNVWERVSSSRVYQRYDWMVQVAADAVFLPRALRRQLRAYEAAGRGGPEDGVYFSTCEPRLRGPVMVVSHGGLEVYNKGAAQCRKTLVGHDLGTCSNDAFVWHCMAYLGLGKVDSSDFVDSSSCGRSGERPTRCTSGPVAFHPFRTPTGYFRCLAQAEHA